MRSQLAQRLQTASLSSVPPPKLSPEYSSTLEELAAHILYLSPLPSAAGLPVFILNAEAFPDSKEVDYSILLPYVLTRLPNEEELISGRGYEVVFFAGGGGDGATAVKKGRPGFGWFIQAYNVLPRATRKRLQKLYIVHEKSWIKVLLEVFSTIGSPKFRRKIFHASTLTGLALHLPIEDLLIPPSVYLHDRTLSRDVHAPYASGRRAFGARQSLPTSSEGKRRLPRVLREATSFILRGSNIKTEGLFRISPHSRLADVLREAYDRGQKFIIWQEGYTIVCYPEPDIDSSRPSIENIGLKEGYGIHLAAGLIKLWYKNLREPLFPPETYRHLRNLSADDESPIDLKRLTDLISPESKWSPLSANARTILTTHLLPLLSTVADHEEANKMSSFNLAICFAPALLCGPDAIEDAKMGAIVRRILEALIEQWNPSLRDACHVSKEDFLYALRAPSRTADYEDPLFSSSPAGSSAEQTQSTPSDPQLYGIALVDNEATLASDEDDRPPLPPRRRPSVQATGIERSKYDDSVDSSEKDFSPQRRPVTPEKFVQMSHVNPSITKRKPAPTVAAPPRYSLATLEGFDQSGSRDPITDDIESTPAINASSAEPTPLSPRLMDDRSEQRPFSNNTPVPARKPVSSQESKSLAG
ncbi:MAG: hypothetical protein M1812_005651 [Candelaria pacifica]|nr:MAG: hypothetical protein M1812_005651 [Candelaria pacifica]